MACQFLILPVEIRRMVYSHIFPDQCVPAHLQRDITLRSDGAPVKISILCACRQIYEEAVDVLYGTVPFDISLTDAAITIAGFTTRLDQFPKEDTFGLIPHYQAQLKKLERRNNQQLLQALGASDRMPKFMSQIKSFNLHISSPYYDSAMLSWVGSAVFKFFALDFDSGFSDVCDILHKLVEYLKNRPQPITNLTVHIRFKRMASDEHMVTHFTKLLLDPLICLRGVANPTIGSISCPCSMYSTDNTFNDVNLLATKSNTDITNYPGFRSYKAGWRAALQSEGHPCSRPFFAKNPLVESTVLT